MSWSASALGVDAADDVGEPDPLVEPHRELSVAERVAEPVEQRGDPRAVVLPLRDRVDARSPDLRLQGGRRALRHDAPVVDDPDPVGEHVGLLEVLRREEDGDAVLARQPRDLVPEGRPRLWIETGRRLVEEEHARAVDERERQVEPALHPAGVAADLAIGRLGQPDPDEELLGARLPLLPAAAPGASSGGGGGRDP